MATEKLEIQVSADVQKAVAGIDKLNRSIEQTSKATPKFEAGLNAATKATPKLTKGVDQAGNAVTNLTRIVSDAPFSVLSGNLIAVSNNIDPLIQSFRSLNTAAGGGKAAFQALISSLSGGAGLALAVSAVTAAITLYSAKQSQAASEAKKAKEDFQSFADIQKEVSASVAREATETEKLIKLLQSEEISRQNKVNALKQLKTISPEYFDGLKLEGNLVKGLSDAYAEYVKNIGLTIEAKTIEKQLEQINQKLLEGKVTNEIQRKLSKDLANVFTEMAKQGGNSALAQKLVNQTLKENVKVTSEDVGLNFQKNILFERLIELYKQIKVEQKGVTSENEKTKKTVEATVEQVRVYNDLIKQSATLQQRTLDPSQDAIQNRPNPINIQRADRTSSLVITPEALRLQGQYALQLDDILEKLRQQQALAQTISDTITGGINAGIDQFFNAIANNQDPFEALAQSVKRLVAELAAAVVKALILKAISSALSGGSSNILDGIFKSETVLRGDNLRTLTFLRR